MSVPVPSFEPMPGPVELEARTQHALKLRRRKPDITNREILDSWNDMLPETRERWLREAREAVLARWAEPPGDPEDIDVICRKLTGMSADAVRAAAEPRRKEQ